MLYFNTNLGATPVVRQVEDLQVVGAATPVDKSTRLKPDRKGNPQRDGLHKGAVSQPSGHGRVLNSLGIAKQYFRMDSIGESFMQGMA